MSQLQKDIALGARTMTTKATNIRAGVQRATRAELLVNAYDEEPAGESNEQIAERLERAVNVWTNPAFRRNGAAPGSDKRWMKPDHETHQA